MGYGYNPRHRYKGRNKPLETRYNNSGYKQFWDEEEGRWVYTHRRVAEKKLGGQIWDGYEVHHKNGDKTDYRPENLVVLSKEEHRRIHEIDREIEDLEEEARYAPRWVRWQTTVRSMS